MHPISNPNVRSRGARVLLCLGLVGLFPGCAHVYTVKVDALRSPDPAPRRTYRIESAIPGREDLDPQYVEAKAVAEEALAARGLFPASRPEWADLVISVDWSVGPRHLKPAPDAGDEYRNAVAIFRPDPGSGSAADSTGALIPTSQLRRMISVSDKKLSLSARENLLGGNTKATSGPELWRVEVSVEDEAGALKELLPVLGTALIEHIDSDSGSGHVKQVSLTRKDTLLLSASR